MTNKLATIFIILFVLSVGIIVYLLTRPTPEPTPSPIQYQYDSLQSVVGEQNDSISKLNLKLSEIKGRDTVIVTKYVKLREEVAGVDEKTLDSLILKYSE